MIGKGELSRKAFLESMNTYNDHLVKYYPNRKELLIKQDEFLLKESVLAIYLHELNQLQLELNQNEYALIN